MKVNISDPFIRERLENSRFYQSRRVEINNNKNK